MVLPNAAVAEQLALYSEFSKSQIEITGSMDELVEAVTANDLPAIQALKNALVAAKDSINLAELQGSTAFAPAEGFPPSLQQLTAAGFTETADDRALGNLVMQLTAKLEQITAFLNALDPNSPTDDEARLDQLNSELEALVNQFIALHPTSYGVVKWSSQLNWMLANTLPVYWHAMVNRTVTTLEQNGLAYLQSVAGKLLCWLASE